MWYFDHETPLRFQKEAMWQFDHQLALRFQKEAETNIPDYERVIDMCLDIAINECLVSLPVLSVFPHMPHPCTICLVLYVSAYCLCIDMFFFFTVVYFLF
jgi:hypothetical protein